MTLYISYMGVVGILGFVGFVVFMILIKVAFFPKVWCIFLIAQKMCRKLSWKRHFEIAFCLESADSNCTAVSKGGKIQNTKLRIEHSTFFGQWKKYQYFSENIRPLGCRVSYGSLKINCLPPWTKFAFIFCFLLWVILFDHVVIRKIQRYFD
jgi:hypothetical protein